MSAPKAGGERELRYFVCAICGAMRLSLRDGGPFGSDSLHATPAGIICNMSVSDWKEYVPLAALSACEEKLKAAEEKIEAYEEWDVCRGHDDRRYLVCEKCWKATNEQLAESERRLAEAVRLLRIINADEDAHPVDLIDDATLPWHIARLDASRDGGKNGWQNAEAFGFGDPV